MKNILLILLLFTIQVNSQNSKLKEFVNDLFYELPSEESAYSMLKEMKKSEFIENPEVGQEMITSKIINNSILNINSMSELLIFFENNKSFQKRIILHDQTDKSNFYSIFNLLNSFNVTFKSKKGIGENKEAETYYFWKGKDSEAFFLIKILPYPKSGEQKVKMAITFSLYEKI
jgi:hypothetical protein